jgi:uncharacterized protein YyaL (SSP411 family)
MMGSAKSAAENPFGFGQILIAIYLYVKNIIEITVTRTNNLGEGYKMAAWLNKQFIPNAITVIIHSHDQSSQLKQYPFFNGINSGRKDGNDYAVICRNFTCSLPIYSLTGLQEHIKSI